MGEYTKKILMMKNLVEIADPHFIVDLMYAGTTHNITGRPVYAEIGMGNHAYVHQDLWQALQKLVPYLDKTGRRLKIYEACRPVKAHERLFAAVPRDGFFIPDAGSSPHCRAAAVDVALVGADGVELLYPTPVDAYNPYYAAEVQAGRLDDFFEYLKKAALNCEDKTIPETAVRNRDELRALMEGVGLVPVPRLHEWWHYELPDGRTDKYPLIDF